jgi:hypothetical protein
MDGMAAVYRSGAMAYRHRPRARTPGHDARAGRYEARDLAQGWHCSELSKWIDGCSPPLCHPEPQARDLLLIQPAACEVGVTRDTPRHFRQADKPSISLFEATYQTQRTQGLQTVFVGRALARRKRSHALEGLNRFETR